MIHIMLFNDRSEVIKKLEKGEYLITKKKTEKNRSSVWECFGIVVDAVSGIKLPWIACFDCKSPYVYLKNVGTSSAARHNCSIIEKNDGIQLNLNEFKPYLTIQLVKLACNDQRPFSIVNGNGFKIFCTSLLEIGVKFGGVELNEILPDSTTISRNVEKMKRDSKRKFADLIAPTVENIGAAFTTDIWIDKYKKNSYISVTCHYTMAWKIVERVLGTFLFMHDKKLAVNIREELLSKLAQFNLRLINVDRIVFVTDGGSNMLLAVNQFEHMVCIAHIINTIERNTFQNSNFSDYPEIMNTIEGIKSLVTYMKRT